MTAWFHLRRYTLVMLATAFLGVVVGAMWGWWQAWAIAAVGAVGAVVGALEWRRLGPVAPMGKPRKIVDERRSA